MLCSCGRRTVCTLSNVRYRTSNTCRPKETLSATKKLLLLALIRTAPLLAPSPSQLASRAKPSAVSKQANKLSRFRAAHLPIARSAENSVAIAVGSLRLDERARQRPPRHTRIAPIRSQIPSRMLCSRLARPCQPSGPAYNTVCMYVLRRTVPAATRLVALVTSATCPAKVNKRALCRHATPFILAYLARAVRAPREGMSTRFFLSSSRSVAVPASTRFGSSVCTVGLSAVDRTHHEVQSRMPSRTYGSAKSAQLGHQLQYSTACSDSICDDRAAVPSTELIVI